MVVPEDKRGWQTIFVLHRLMPGCELAEILLPVWPDYPSRVVGRVGTGAGDADLVAARGLGPVERFVGAYQPGLEALRIA